MRLFERLGRRWKDAAARRAEMSLEPTWRRRLDRLPQRRRDRAALRAERRTRAHDFDGELHKARSKGYWS